MIELILPPPPVELKRCQEYFLNPPSNVTKPNLVCDEIMRWKGMGWRLRKLMKHYPTLNEMTQGFTTLLKGIVESHHAFRAKYQFHAMTLSTMTVTTEELVQFFTLVESLLPEFHSSKGYTSVLAPLVDYQQKNTVPKNPKLNAADGNKNQDNPDQSPERRGKGGQSSSGTPPSGTSFGGGKKADGGKPSGSNPKKVRDQDPQNKNRGVTHRLPKKNALDDFPRVNERVREEEERKQAQLRPGIPIRMDAAQGIWSSPEFHSPSQNIQQHFASSALGSHQHGIQQEDGAAKFALKVARRAECHPTHAFLAACATGTHPPSGALCHGCLAWSASMAPA
eukprot:252663-Amphidinium_carterae.9